MFNTSSGFAADTELVNIRNVDDSIVVNMKYATNDNFMKEVLYDFDQCVLRSGTANKLAKANQLLKAKGYKIQVYDCYRPLSVQRKMYDRFPLKGYVADPKKGSNHNRGGAVDCTLLTLNGDFVPMPSEYDEFSERSHQNYPANEPLSTHRSLLRDAMTQVGFKTISKEWWHYDDIDIASYALEEEFPENLR